jgi:hypothetical protein
LGAGDTEASPPTAASAAANDSGLPEALRIGEAAGAEGEDIEIAAGRNHVRSGATRVGVLPRGWRVAHQNACVAF